MVSSAERDEHTGRFLKGHHGNGGRQRYSRNKLAHALVSALSEDFDQYGAAAIKKVREQDTSTYLRIIAGVIPSKLDTTVTITNIFAEYNLTDPADFNKAW